MTAPNPLPIDSTDPLLRAAARRLESCQPLARELANLAYAQLCEWRLPRESLLTALLLPALLERPEALQSLADTFGQPASRAARAASFLSSLLLPAPLGAETAAGRYSAVLRSLLHQIYLDLPDFSTILCLLADHEARWQLDPSPTLAEHSQAVFIPLSEMLGLWPLRQRWVEGAALQLSRLNAAQEKHYQRLAELCGDPQLYTAENLRSLALNWRGRTLSADQKRLLGKAEGYLAFEQQLLERCAAEGIPAPEITPRRLQPGTILRRSADRESQEEITERLGVRITCASQQDCYRVLGLLHALGKPVAPKYSERFDDYIAAPQPNGYRALHTALVFRGFRGENRGRLLIESRLVTPELHELNELGVVAAFYQHPERYRGLPAWWNSLERLDEKLRQIHPDKSITSLQAYLRTHEIGSLSRLLYLFTPRGEIILMEPNSTPLDYAYHIHTDLGHHAGRITVNGQAAPFNHPLRNGDLIQVQYTPNSAGPDLSWLAFVNTTSARTKIRHTINNRARAVHPGRLELLETLFRIIDTYKCDRNFELRVAGSQLEIYLEKAARQHRLPSVNAIYQQIEADPTLAQRLLEGMVSEMLIAVVVDADGQPLDLPPEQLVVCNTCRPVPGDPIVGLRRTYSGVLRDLIIHRADSNCIVNTPDRRLRPVAWLDNPRQRISDLFWLKVEADDRPRLLVDVLEAIHALPQSTILQVTAQAFPSGQAEISIAVEANGGEHLSQLQQRMEAVNNVRSVWSMPATPVQHLALTALPESSLANPYIEREVDTPNDFYDRVEATQAISDWLKTEGPATWMALHGQRRVGKSSLARFYARQVAPRLRAVLPVYLSLQTLGGYTTAHLADLIARSVCQAVNLALPERGSAENPAEWLARVLRAAGDHLGEHRLLVILDELDMLLDALREGRAEELVFYNLRAVMKQLPAYRWLLILQDSFFYERHNRASVNAVLQECRDLHLLPLDSTWADKLIREPSEGLGIRYDDDFLPGVIHDLTGGSPYLIKAVCFNLVNQAREQARTVITHRDLERARGYMVSEGGRYFNHYFKYLSGEGNGVLMTLSQASEENDWVAEEELLARLDSLSFGLTERIVRRELKRLASQGLVERRSQPRAEVRFSVRLFYDYMRTHYDSEIDLRGDALPAAGTGGVP